MTYYYLTGAILLMLVGIVGVIIPAVPGIGLMAVVALLFNFLVKQLPLWVIIVLVLITILSFLIDQLSGILGSRIFGASGRSMLFGFLGMILGLIIFPPLGAIIGLFVGILATELSLKKESTKAVKTASGGVLSIIIGTVINLFLALSFLTIFVVGVI